MRTCYVLCGGAVLGALLLLVLSACGRAEAGAQGETPVGESEVEIKSAAARAFAEKVVKKDDGRYIDAFMTGYNAANQVDGSFGREKWNLGSSILKSERYRINFEILTKDPHKAVVDTAAPEISECVSLLSKGSLDGICCSGVLLSANRVLSARHCEEMGCDKFVLFDDGKGNNKIVAIDHPINFGPFDSATRKDDIALFSLHGNLDISGLTIPDLATTADTDGAISVRAVGFGETDGNCVTGGGKRNKVDLGVISRRCDVAEDQASYACNKDIELVAGYAYDGRGTCHGDSGGPAFAGNSSGGKRLLAGIISRTAASSREISVFVRVEAFSNWIRSNL